MCVSVCVCVCAAQGGGKYGSMKGTSGKASEAPPSPPRGTRMYSTLKLAAGPLLHHCFPRLSAGGHKPPRWCPCFSYGRAPPCGVPSPLSSTGTTVVTGVGVTSPTSSPSDGLSPPGLKPHGVPMTSVALPWMARLPQDAPRTGPSLSLHIVLQVT